MVQTIRVCPQVRVSPGHHFEKRILNLPTCCTSSVVTHWRGVFASLTFGLHIMGVLVFVLGFWVTIRLLLQKHNYFRHLSRVLPERLRQSWVAVSDSEESLISEQSMEHGSYQKCSVALDQKDDADTYAV